ncbi:13805_t:CDS:2, partial [Ambispora leptoticha]
IHQRCQTTVTSRVGNEEETTTEHYTLDRECDFKSPRRLFSQSSRADEDFIEALKTTDESNSLESTVEIRPNVEFVWASTKTKLLSIKFGGLTDLTQYKSALQKKTCI